MRALVNALRAAFYITVFGTVLYTLVMMQVNGNG